MEWLDQEGKCPVFSACNTNAFDMLWIRISYWCSYSLFVYPLEVSPIYFKGHDPQGTEYTWLLGFRCVGLLTLTKSPNLTPLLVVILIDEPAMCWIWSTSGHVGSVRRMGAGEWRQVAVVWWYRDLPLHVGGPGCGWSRLAFFASVESRRGIPAF